MEVPEGSTASLAHPDPGEKDDRLKESAVPSSTPGTGQADPLNTSSNEVNTSEDPSVSFMDHPCR